MCCCCKLVNIKHSACDIYIGRPSKFGNPYTSSKKSNLAKFNVNTLEESLLGYRNYLVENKQLLIDIEQLRDKTIGCYCIDSEEYKIRDKIICHGQIIQMYLQNPTYVIDIEIFKQLLYNRRIFNSIF